MRYDLIITGNDEAAFQTAVAAVKNNFRTLVVISDKCVSSWLAGNALQNLASELLNQRQVDGQAKKPIGFASRYQQHLNQELQSFSTSLRRQGVDVLNARAEIKTSSQLALTFPNVSRPVVISTSNVIIATGIERTAFQTTEPSAQQLRPSAMLTSAALPQRLRIIGGGDFGAALAACLQLTGINTELITRTHQESSALELTVSAGVDIVDHPTDLRANRCSDSVFHEVDCRGRRGLTQDLQLDRINVEADEHGQLWCGRHFETWCRGIYGVGDVVGFSPDSTLPVAEQAQIVVARMLQSRNSHSAINGKLAVA